MAENEVHWEERYLRLKTEMETFSNELITDAIQELNQAQVLNTFVQEYHQDRAELMLLITSKLRRKLEGM